MEKVLLFVEDHPTRIKIVAGTNQGLSPGVKERNGGRKLSVYLSRNWAYQEILSKEKQKRKGSRGT